MKNGDDIDGVIDRAMVAVGKHVADQSTARQDFVIGKLRAELDRLRPCADWLIYGPSSYAHPGVPTTANHQK